MAKIEEAIVRFLIDNGTFYASLISQMHRIEDRKQPTVAVSIRNGRVNLHHNPDFLDPRTMKDTKAILEHECLHIVMEHHARAEGKEISQWKIACDLAINQLIKNLPEDALTVDKVFDDDMYKMNILRMEKAEYYYDKIKKSNKAQEQIKQMMAQGKCGCGDDLQGGKMDKGSEIQIDKELMKEIVKGMVNEAAKAAKGQGDVPRGLEKYIDELFTPSKVSWRALLRRFVANSVKSGTRPSWKKPSRRYGDTQKGKVADRTISLAVVIDTSGSIDDGVLQIFMNELQAIQSCYKSVITVLECDAEVGREYKLQKYQKLRRDVTGRGGTSFKPPFIYLKKKNIRADAVIYFTDLEGDFPDKRPAMPVLWGYYNAWGMRHNIKVPFGTVVHLEKDKETHNENQ